MAMGNEDYGKLLHRDDRVPQDRGAPDHGTPEYGAQDETTPVHNAFSRRVSRTSKQPWYEPYLRKIRRTH